MQADKVFIFMLVAGVILFQAAVIMVTREVTLCSAEVQEIHKLRRDVLKLTREFDHYMPREYRELIP